jgi:hypothetical protein
MIVNKRWWFGHWLVLLFCIHAKHIHSIKQSIKTVTLWVTLRQHMPQACCSCHRARPSSPFTTNRSTSTGFLAGCGTACLGILCLSRTISCLTTEIQCSCSNPEIHCPCLTREIHCSCSTRKTQCCSFCATASFWTLLASTQVNSDCF